MNHIINHIYESHINHIINQYKSHISIVISSQTEVDHTFHATFHASILQGARRADAAGPPQLGPGGALRVANNGDPATDGSPAGGDRWEGVDHGGYHRKTIGKWRFTLWLCQQFAIENGHIEIVDFPRNGDFNHSYGTVYQRVPFANLWKDGIVHHVYRHCHLSWLIVVIVVNNVFF